MKGYQFYLEYPDEKEKRKASIRAKRLGNHSGTVFALWQPDATEVPDEQVRSMLTLKPEGLGAVFGKPNSPVCWTGASRDYLAKQCKRIPEKLAREIHPELFKRLDD